VNQKRTAILLVAIIVGALAAFLLFNYVQGIEDRANEGAQRVQAFRAKNLIPRGTPGETAASAGDIEDKGIPQDIRPDTAITSLEEIQAKVALFDIAPGTVIVQGMFVDPASAQISFRERLKNKNHVAITIQVDPVRAVGGFLVAGDEVNIMVMEERTQPENPEAGGEPQTQPLLARAARVLYQDVQIIAVGQNVLLEPGEAPPEGEVETAGTNLLTLNVPPKAAQWLASFDNEFYLALTPESYEPIAIEPLPTLVEQLPGEDPALLTPYCGPLEGGVGDGTDPCPPPPEGQ
jgi:Flp pilus assembly protein CpaB